MTALFAKFVILGSLVFTLFCPSLLLADSHVIVEVKVTPLPFDANTGATVDVVTVESSSGLEFEYRWFVNGEENFFEKGQTFPGSLLKRGDQLSIEITPITFNGERLRPFISLPIETGNASPQIISEPPSTLTDQGFSYLVKATDPDADPLTFQMAEAPAGMVIDSQSGQITWQFDTMPQGVFPVKIIVEDGYDGRAEQTFELNLSLVEKKGIQ